MEPRKLLTWTRMRSVWLWNKFLLRVDAQLDLGQDRTASLP
jgi:hypothetical protein